jgi:hypothetical protein
MSQRKTTNADVIFVALLSTLATLASSKFARGKPTGANGIIDLSMAHKQVNATNPKCAAAVWSGRVTVIHTVIGRLVPTLSP